MGGSSYIPLPDWIMRKKAIVNIRNTDEKCFFWSIPRYLHPLGKNDIRISDLKQYENDLNTQGIDFPVRVKEISKFEEKQFHLILKYGLLTLISFFKHLLPILLEMYDQMIFTTERQYSKKS